MSKPLLSNLTLPQKTALRKFEPGCKRRSYPDINPRTASALWSLGLLKGEIADGTRQFVLTKTGEEVRKLLS